MKITVKKIYYNNLWKRIDGWPTMIISTDPGFNKITFIYWHDIANWILKITSTRFLVSTFISLARSSGRIERFLAFTCPNCKLFVYFLFLFAKLFIGGSVMCWLHCTVDQSPRCWTGMRIKNKKAKEKQWFMICCLMSLVTK